MNASTTIWSGYVVTGAPHSVVCVEGSWVQPTVTCPKTGARSVATWIGIDGYNLNDLVQIGSSAACEQGQAIYFTWEETLPLEPVDRVLSVSVRPGDHLWAQVLYDANGRFDLRIDNLTVGGWTTVGQYVSNAPRRTAEWIVEDASIPGLKQQPLLSFGQVTWTACDATIGTEHGPIDDAAWTRTRLTMARGGTRMASPSQVGPTGFTFSVRWLHS